MTRAVVTPDALADAARASGFSPAVRAGDLLFLTGATGGAPDGTMPPDAAAQAQNALSKVEAILAAAGAGVDAVVEVTSFQADVAASFDAVQVALEARLGTPLPAWTAVEAGPRRPGAPVEFRAVAHAPA